MLTARKPPTLPFFMKDGRSVQPKVCIVRVIMWSNVVGRSYQLAPGQHFVGRTRTASVFLRDATISPVCAKIFCDESGMWRFEHYEDYLKSQRILVDYQQVRISPAHQLLFRFE